MAAVALLVAQEPGVPQSTDDASRSTGTDSGVGLDVSLDFPNRVPPVGTVTGSYYELFDLDFGSGAVGGQVRVGATQGRGGVTRDVVLSSPDGHWARHLSARLFKDGLEMGPAEYIVVFRPGEGRGSPGKADSRQVSVGKLGFAEARFTVSGSGGSALEPGLYRLWIILDMRHLPLGKNVFRGIAVNAGYDSGQNPDPARKDGLVFMVRKVGADPLRRAQYLAQRSALETLSALEQEASANPDREEIVSHRRKAIELAANGLQLAPRSLELLALMARNHVRLDECDEAIPYVEAVIGIDPEYLKEDFYHDRWMQLCMTSGSTVPAVRRRTEIIVLRVGGLVFNRLPIEIRP